MAATRPVISTTAGRASTGAATCSARHQISAHPATRASPPSSSTRPSRPGSTSPSSATAPAASRNAIQRVASESRNQAVIPPPSATGSQSGNCARSASSQRSTASPVWRNSAAPPI
ncbi:hypothetical protein FHR20_001060 [Sphingomonas leidyi]|uniref:Uncharacterized protein n=1 Tax=Sphingomonas leidyi TaxID=68569 RepID=A0A7X5UXI9_9SPHN|nr:hypothetical protein [Sphingomonas leidyi]